MESNTNYKHLFLDKIEEFITSNPEYSIGEIIHSILVQMNRKGFNAKKWGIFLELSDHQIYTCIDKAIKQEEKED